MKMRIMFLLLILCASFLIACADDSSGEFAATTQSPAGGETAGEGAELEGEQQQRILSQAPVRDFGGAYYRILGRLAVSADRHWDAPDLFAEELTGDIINDAVFTRNRAIEERFNVNITRTEADPPGETARRLIQAGSDEYDIIYDALWSTVGLASGGFGFDLHDVPFLDLAKPWYDQNANSQLSIGGRLFTTFSDFTILDKEATWVYLFNKQLISDLELEDPYVLVREGRWTIDKLYEMARSASRDLTGDGVMGLWDQYGYMGEGFNMYVSLLAAGVNLFPKDANDLPTFNGIPERAFRAFEGLMRVLANDEIALLAEHAGRKGFAGGNVFTDVMDRGFMEGRVLFSHAGMNRVTLFREMEVDFGIIPPPKFDEAQEEFHVTVTSHAATSFVIPITLHGEALERVGILTDALAAESRYTLIPAYYDQQLTTKLLRDEESGEMLDIIFASRKFDLGLIHGFGGLPGIFNTAMTSNNPNIASQIERATARIERDIERLIETYENIGR